MAQTEPGKVRIAKVDATGFKSLWATRQGLNRQEIADRRIEILLREYE